jgi:hypothetical protein
MKNTRTLFILCNEVLSLSLSEAVLTQDDCFQKVSDVERRLRELELESEAHHANSRKLIEAKDAELFELRFRIKVCIRFVLSSLQNASKDIERPRPKEVSVDNVATTSQPSHSNGISGEAEEVILPLAKVVAFKDSEISFLRNRISQLENSLEESLKSQCNTDIVYLQNVCRQYLMTQEEVLLRW